MSDFQRHVHSNGLMTEVLAYDRAKRSVARIKDQIIADLEDPKVAGDGGITPDEFVLLHGGLINTVRRRFTDLRVAGKVRHHPNKVARINSSGNLCAVWVLGDDRPAVGVRSVARRDEHASSYIEGFDAGCDYIITEVERWAQMHDNAGSILTLLAHLRREANPQKNSCRRIG